MEIIIKKNYEEMSKVAASIIADQIKSKPNSVLGLATGSTPIGTYDELVSMNKAGEISFADIKTVNLDEYKGLPREHKESYFRFMRDHLLSHVDINLDNCFIPDGLASDAKAACIEYEDKVRSLGGQDLQLLGLGHNGHIGFNEPGDSFVKDTHVVDLTDRTITANQRFFNSYDEVPKQALTMGIGTIMQAAKILVIVSGKDKAEAVRDAIEGPITPSCQASILQLHKNVIFVVDEDAASLLK